LKEIIQRETEEIVKELAADPESRVFKLNEKLESFKFKIFQLD